MADSARYEIVTKIEAAERQLRVAIRLFFEHKDLIAVHTLATAAQGVLVDLAQARGIKSLFQHERIKPEYREEVNRAFRAAQNFFKHADRDPEEKLPFFSESTKFHLFDAARLDCMITGRMLPEVAGLLGWFMNKFPHLFDAKDVPELAAAIELAKSQNFDDFDLVLIAIDQLARPPR